MLRAIKTRLGYRLFVFRIVCLLIEGWILLWNYLACLSRSHTLIITTMENSVKFAFDVETHDVLYNTLVLLPQSTCLEAESNQQLCVYFPPQFVPSLLNRQTLPAGLFIQMSVSPDDDLMKDLLLARFSTVCNVSKCRGAETRRGAGALSCCH